MIPEEGRPVPASFPDSGRSAEPARFETLDALRGVAAVMVTILHANPTGPIFGHRLFSAGSLFVDFFFVLSGFVIAAAYGDRLAGGFSRARFLWLRVGRIWPVHAVVLLAYLAIELSVLLSGNGQITGREAFGAERRVGDFAIQFLLLHAFYPPALFGWLLQSWSIAIEMMLYLLVALGWPLARRGWGWISLAVALAAGVWLSQDDSTMLHAHQRGLFGFGLGVGAWLAWERLGHRLTRLSRGAASLIEAVAVLAVAACLATWGGDLTRLIYVPLFALVVLAFAAQRGWLSDRLRSGPMIFVGLVSYSLYAVHGLALTLTMRGLDAVAGALGQPDALITAPGINRPFAAQWLGLAGDGVLLLGLLVSLAAAWALFRLVENPARLWSRRQAQRF